MRYLIMNERKMPVVFSGHGSPMLALEQSNATKELKRIGDTITAQYEKPKAILSISAHWYTEGLFVQSSAEPEQVYDMYGFPQELYDFKYPAKGSAELTESVLNALGSRVSVNDEWGIDHGTWTVLCHMFPEADIPVVQLSVSSRLTSDQCLEIGRLLAPLRSEGFLIFASGNVVHNLGRVDWSNAGGSPMAEEFNADITNAVINHRYDEILRYDKHAYAYYAVPTPEHFLPLLYILGAAGDDKPLIFNNFCNLGAIAMTGFAFGLKDE